MSDLNEIRDRSALHAVGVSIAQQTQQSFERQRRLWQLRERHRSVAAELSALAQEIAIEEKEQERDARLFEMTCERFGEAPTEGVS